MSNQYPLSNLSDYEIMISSPLNDYDRKMLTVLYMPLVGDKAISLYQTMYTIVPEGKYESELEKHDKIIKLMRLRSIARFSDLKSKLEAVGLLKTYYKDGLYIYALKKPLCAEAFFTDEALATLLEYQIGKDEYMKYFIELAVRRLDINKFENITCSFDDIYKIEDSDDIMLSQASFNNINNGIYISNKEFNFERFLILLSAHEIIQPIYFTDETFINNVKRYSFLYMLTPEEMKDAVIIATNQYKEVNYIDLAKAAKKIYTDKGKKLGIVPKTVVNPTSSSNDKLVRFLEKTTPSELVRHKTGTALMATEIEMFDQLLKDTNITIGVLNVLINYVLENLNGEIPAYNYFLKIINTWKRAKVKSTEDAIAYINNRDKTKASKPINKTKKDVPSWYNDYREELNKDITKDNNSKNTEGLEELTEFFKPIGKE